MTDWLSCAPILGRHDNSALLGLPHIYSLRETGISTQTYWAPGCPLHTGCSVSPSTDSWNIWLPILHFKPYNFTCSLKHTSNVTFLLSFPNIFLLTAKSPRKIPQYSLILFWHKYRTQTLQFSSFKTSIVFCIPIPQLCLKELQKQNLEEWRDKSSLKWKWKSLSCVPLLSIPWTTQSMEFSRPEYWSG